MYLRAYASALIIEKLPNSFDSMLCYPEVDTEYRYVVSPKETGEFIDRDAMVEFFWRLACVIGGYAGKEACHTFAQVSAGMWAITLERPVLAVNQVRYSWPLIPVANGVGGARPARYGMALTFHDLLASVRASNVIPFFVELSYAQASRKSTPLAPTKEYLFWYWLLMFPWSTKVARHPNRFEVGDFPIQGAPACLYVQ